MLALLDWVYGPQGYGDPYYLLMRDFILVMPWWYPYFWVALIGGILGWRQLRRMRARAAAKRGMRRVKARTQRVLDRQRDDIAAIRRRRMPAQKGQGGCAGGDAQGPRVQGSAPIFGVRRGSESNTGRIGPAEAAAGLQIVSYAARMSARNPSTFWSSDPA